MVAIKDMKMPESCFYCRLRYEERDDCGELSGYHYCILDPWKRLSFDELYEKRSTRCQLIELKP